MRTLVKLETQSDEGRAYVVRYTTSAGVEPGTTIRTIEILDHRGNWRPLDEGAEIPDDCWFEGQGGLAPGVDEFLGKET
jgi:hypothetical protein